MCGGGSCKSGIFQSTFFESTAGDGVGIFRSEFWLVGGGIFKLGGNFVVAVVVVKAKVEEFQLMVERFMRAVWDCFNGRIYFLWHLSLILVEANVPDVGEDLWDADASRFCEFVFVFR